MVGFWFGLVFSVVAVAPNISIKAGGTEFFEGRVGRGASLNVRLPRSCAQTHRLDVPLALAIPFAACHV